MPGWVSVKQMVERFGAQCELPIREPAAMLGLACDRAASVDTTVHGQVRRRAGRHSNELTPPAGNPAAGVGGVG